MTLSLTHFLLRSTLYNHTPPEATNKLSFSTLLVPPLCPNTTHSHDDLVTNALCFNYSTICRIFDLASGSFLLNGLIEVESDIGGLHVAFIGNNICEAIQIMVDVLVVVVVVM